MFYKTNALVLKRHKLADSDVILTLFTRKAGKVRAVAKGARNTRSKLAAGAQPFVHGEYTISKGKNLDKVTQISIENSYYSIREDLTRLSYASYFIELCDAIIHEGQTNNRLFNEILRTLKLITEVKSGYNIIRVAFELKIFHYSGVLPDLKRCMVCGKSMPAITIYLSISEGGLVCGDCKHPEVELVEMDETLIRLMQFLVYEEYDRIRKVKIGRSLIKKLTWVNERYLKYHVTDKRLKSLAILESISHEEGE